MLSHDCMFPNDYTVSARHKNHEHCRQVLTSTATNSRTMLTAVMSVGSSLCTSGFMPISAQLVITAMALINSNATCGHDTRVQYLS